MRDSALRTCPRRSFNCGQNIAPCSTVSQSVHPIRPTYPPFAGMSLMHLVVLTVRMCLERSGLFEAVFSAGVSIRPRIT